MLEVSKRPLFTETWEDMEKFIPHEDSSYLFGSSLEERSAHSPEWEQNASRVQFVPILRQDAFEIEVGLNGRTVLPLRGVVRLKHELAERLSETVYLDITGLAHHVWAPLVRALLAARRIVRVVYVEPGEYRRSMTPTEGELFALTERINGLAPLPGFASLGASGNDAVFIPLLGFEGTRMAYLQDKVQAPADLTIPIVGVPGFRPEYPFHSYLGNRPALESTRTWHNVHFARANCPFSLYYVLEDIGRRFPEGALRIAPIGTKPHALGAVLFALLSARPVELLYDHPVRKDRRTMGSARVCVYHVSSFPFASTTLEGSIPALRADRTARP